MRLVDYKIIANQKLTEQVCSMRLFAPFDGNPPHAGQFVNVQINGLYLRRPISICDYDRENGILTLVYKIIGQGTTQMAAMRTGENLNIMQWLGNGYSLVRAKKPILVGGGVGVPPLFYLAKQLLAIGQVPTVILGFRTADEVILYDDFRRLAVSQTIVTTEDGSYGARGFVTDALKTFGGYDAVYSCGPEPMLKAIYAQTQDVADHAAQFSFERRMGCGFGACMGCSCETIAGYKRICKEGPVLTKEDIVW
ncbi:MAG: dihydroorotate dehydrogenase electron transfer subunit [Oscillospiraceae bacterium]|jgi:dihydroorotate dehydrogenase electron transfer subunit|nr:dihydroorotate dehydrogenase electron transfer subunit [Oscillospiraceae bacterium]